MCHAPEGCPHGSPYGGFASAVSVKKKSVFPHCFSGQRTLFMYLTLLIEFHLNVLLTEEEPCDRRGPPPSVKRRQTVKHELLWALNYV